MSRYEIGVEPSWTVFWNQARDLAKSHFEEVDGGVEPRRKFQMDHPRMVALVAAGSTVLVNAKRDGQMVGYFTWSIMPDLESEGLLIGMQGAWYAAPGNWRAAVEMFDYSIEILRKIGVQCIFPHHRVQGRGANIGRFFIRRGATRTQTDYCLWIGQEPSECQV